MKPRKQGQQVIAIEVDVVKRSSEAAPSGHVAIFDANDVSCGPEAHTAAAQRTLDQCDLEFNGRSRRDVAGRQEVNARRADILGDERDGRHFRAALDAGQLQRQAEAGSRAASAVFRDAYRVSRHAQKILVVQVGTDLMDFSNWSVSGSNRELQFRKCPHVDPPSPGLALAETGTMPDTT
jgi:hypothetical protein